MVIGPAQDSHDDAARTARTWRLLSGEPEDSSHREDVVHWVAVYSELSAFLRETAIDLDSECTAGIEERLTHWRRRLRHARAGDRHPAQFPPRGDAA